MRSLGWALAACLCLLSAAHADDTAQRRYVCVDGTRLLSRPAAFSKSLARLRKGQSLAASAPSRGYVHVSVDLASGTVTGYIPARALQDSRPKLDAGATASSDASAQEVAAATKGFNRQIEANLRASDTKGGYLKLDQALGRTGFSDPVAGLADWRSQGRIGEFQGGAQ
ncbi:MAG TPA: hypothetical protein VK842_07350 [bacterium]|jgi:hypothetical protein|nr:hypothetical protein [bacterium]HXC63190.1 hypothetical protein [bacterium]